MNHYTLSAEEISVNISEDKIRNLMVGSESSMIIGQPRAVKALEMGTEIKGKGYNIFVTGISGTGRISAIKKILGSRRDSKPDLQDIVYVYNFKAPDNPEVLYLEKGRGNELKKISILWLKILKRA